MCEISSRNDRSAGNFPQLGLERISTRRLQSGGNRHEKSTLHCKESRSEVMPKTCRPSSGVEPFKELCIDIQKSQFLFAKTSGHRGCPSLLRQNAVNDHKIRVVPL